MRLLSLFLITLIASQLLAQVESSDITHLGMVRFYKMTEADVRAAYPDVRPVTEFRRLNGGVAKFAIDNFMDGPDSATLYFSFDEDSVTLSGVTIEYTNKFTTDTALYDRIAERFNLEYGSQEKNCADHTSEREVDYKYIYWQTADMHVCLNYYCWRKNGSANIAAFFSAPYYKGYTPVAP